MATCEVFHDYIVQCTTELQVNALLAPATQYKWVLIDKFDKEYSGYSTTDGSGFFVIPITSLPEGLLISYSGEFTLKVMDAVDDCKSHDFKMAKYYDEICFHIKTGTRIKQSLGCSFDCVAADGGNGNSAVFPVSAGGTSSHIVWTSLLNSLYGSAPLVQYYELVAPNTYQLLTVSITQNQSGYILNSIDVDFGGTSPGGYVLISA